VSFYVLLGGGISKHFKVQHKKTFIFYRTLTVKLAAKQKNRFVFCTGIPGTAGGGMILFFSVTFSLLDSSLE